MSQNEIENAAVVVNTGRPQSTDERQVAMSLKVSENLLKRHLEENLKLATAAAMDAQDKFVKARDEAFEYAKAYGRKELLHSGLIDELVDSINAILNLSGTETFTRDTFLRDIGVGVPYCRQRSTYDRSVSNSVELLDNDGLLVVRPVLGVDVLLPSGVNDDNEDAQVVSYHVSIDSKLNDLIKALKAADKEHTECVSKRDDIKNKLKNIKRTVEDVETDLLVKQLKEMEGGTDVFAQVTSILSSYVNDQERPSLLEAPKDE